MFLGTGSLFWKIKRRILGIMVLMFLLSLCGCMQTFPVHESFTKKEAEAPSIKRTRYIAHHDEEKEPVSTVDQDSPAILQKSSVEDIWEFVRTSEPLEKGENQAITTQLEKLKGNQFYFDLISKRAKTFIYQIASEIEKRKMPLFLALLPVIESGYKTDVISSSSAAGLWQFTPSTAEHFGLKQNWWYDGRLDILASTAAALDYLQQLYEEFGDWKLALAAYNSGSATVHRAIKKNIREGRPQDYWSLELPAETRLYVPKLVALQRVVRSPDQFSIKLPHIPTKPVVKQVNTGGQIQLQKVADLANISLGELKRLNPGFKRWATDPDGPHQLLIPIESADRLEVAIAHLPETERVTWQHHKIRPGESLWTIARKYGISIDLLKRANKLSSDKLRSGKSLLIPGGPSIASRGEKKEIRDIENGVYRVQNGDSLWLIARRFDIHVRQIIEWNNISRDTPLKPGLKLKILLNRPILEAAAL